MIEPTRQIVEHIRSRHPATPIIGFPRLGGILVREYAQKTGINTLALDTVADPAQVSDLVAPHCSNLTLQGNMDPMILFRVAKRWCVKLRQFGMQCAGNLMFSTLDTV